MTFEHIEKKIKNPPAAQNVARLLDPSSEIKTTQNIARFAVGIPAFNYNSALAVCKDRVALNLDLGTALKAVSSAGAPAGRAENASLVKAFFQYDKSRGYSDLRSVDTYDGEYRISREIRVPTKPTFVVLEHGKQIPVLVCGWKTFKLERDQIRAWLTMLDSGLFSFADYRSSPWELRLFPEMDTIEGSVRMPICIGPDEYPLFSEREMRELAAMYERAQQAAMPIARELWESREARRREYEREVQHLEPSRVTPYEPDLFRSGPSKSD